MSKHVVALILMLAFMLVGTSIVFAGNAKGKILEYSIVGKWDPNPDEIGEDYEPYMLDVKEDGTYQIITEDEANNISGTWKKDGDSKYVFSDPIGFMGDYVTILSSKGSEKLATFYQGKQNSTFIRQK